MAFAVLALVLGSMFLVPILDDTNDAEPEEPVEDESDPADPAVDPDPDADPADPDADPADPADPDADPANPADPDPADPAAGTTATQVQITDADGTEIQTVETEEANLAQNTGIALEEGDTGIVVDPDGQTNVTVSGNFADETFQIGRGDSVAPNGTPIEGATDADEIQLVITQTAFEDQVASTPGNQPFATLEEATSEGSRELLEGREQNFGQIALNDENDALDIVIDDGILGNLHVVEFTWQQDGETSTGLQTSLYYVLTTEDITELDTNMFFDDSSGSGSTFVLNASNDDIAAGKVQIIAEVTLGTSQTSDVGGENETTTGIFNFDSPDITTSRAITSTLQATGEF